MKRQASFDDAIFRRATHLAIRVLIPVLTLAATFSTARADNQTPNRAARLSYLNGTVTVERVNNTGSDTAQLNIPLTQGQRINTGENGQAEIEFEDGSLLRVTPYSSVSLDSMTVDSSGNAQTTVSVLSGLVYAELRSAPKYAYTIQAGSDTITPVENTTVRINLDHPPAILSVFTGTIHVANTDDTSGGYQTDVRSGENLTEDPSSPNRYFLTQQIAQDSWDQWNEERDQDAADQAANRTTAGDGYAGDQGYGWADLDANGTWYDVPGQGQVWQPTIAAASDFDPYGYGSWAWYPGAGYVWASGYSWGWTPYRCGNWSYWGGFGWGWMPGAGCGLYGWGFGGGGVYPINIIHPPLGYRPVPRPIRNPGLTSHPIVVVRAGRGPTAPVQQAEGPRTIAGQVATPIHPAGNAFVSNGTGSTGAALLRDYPVDRTSRQPVLGTIASPEAGFRSNQMGPIAPMGEVARPAPVIRPAAPSAPPRPMPPPRASYPSAPPPHYSAPPPPPHATAPRGH